MAGGGATQSVQSVGRSVGWSGSNSRDQSGPSQPSGNFVMFKFCCIHTQPVAALWYVSRSSESLVLVQGCCADTSVFAPCSLSLLLFGVSENVGIINNGETEPKRLSVHARHPWTFPRCHLTSRRRQLAQNTLPRKYSKYY